MKTALMSAASVAAFASAAAAPAAPAAAPAAPTPAAKAPTAPAAAKAAPVITAVSLTVAIPDRKSKRGSSSIYPFDQLTAPTRDAAGNLTAAASFGVKDRTTASMSSIVSNANRKAMTERRDPTTQAIIYKHKELTDAEGNVTKVPTTEPEMVPAKRFFAVDVDAKTDPDGASVRVFRDI